MSLIFDVNPDDNGGHELIMSNKFGAIVDTHPEGNFEIEPAAMDSGFDWPSSWAANDIFPQIVSAFPALDWPAARGLLSEIGSHASQHSRKQAIDLLCLLLNRKYDTGTLRTSRSLD